MSERKTKKLTEYFAPRSEDVHLVQAKVPISLYEAVSRARFADGLQWQEIVIAGLKKYLDDRVDTKSKAK